MSTAKQTRREIAQKKARVAYLHQTVRECLPHVQQRFEDGFFTTCAERFRDFSQECEEMTRLQSEIQQLAFDLERLEEEQSELCLSEQMGDPATMHRQLEAIGASMGTGKPPAYIV